MLNPRDFRMWWAGDKGWMIDTEFALSPSAVRGLTAYTLRVQKQRLTGLLPGEKRDECERTIAALEAGDVHQNLVGTGEKVLFDAYKSKKLTLDMGAQ